MEMMIDFPVVRVSMPLWQFTVKTDQPPALLRRRPSPRFWHPSYLCWNLRIGILPAARSSHEGIRIIQRMHADPSSG